ncbi:molybdopterin-guanine dinucleotide biosynthesis protein MobB, partial [Escherichia coli]|uniref:molybdopterin-guanine dinucleotide biosynthesis protein MobB n=1 Tax=Escherichia coli TaxID=562 RepID=UPI003EDEA980
STRQRRVTVSSFFLPSGKLLWRIHVNKCIFIIAEINRMTASQQRWALMTETPDEEELDLQFLASRMDTSKLDLILVEGFKHEEIAKIVLFRDGAGHRPEELVIDRHVIAVASDVPLNLDVALLDINDVEGLADFVVEWMQKQNG